MWETYKGGCACYYCRKKEPHPDRPAHAMTVVRFHNQVAESLKTSDLVKTKMCPLCTHEERDES